MNGLLLVPLAILLVMVFAGALALFAIVFWIWMFIDCLQKRNFNDKLVWIIVLIFLHVFGAVLYYFLVKTKKRSSFE